MAQLNQLERNSPNKKKKTIGRGGKRGTYSGKGMKGQKARSGRKMRPELRDIIKKIPKKRGYAFNSIPKKPAVSLNLSVIQKALDKRNEGMDVKINPKALVAMGLVKKQEGRVPTIKILGDGNVTRKYNVAGCAVSASAREKIMSAQGHVA